MEIKKCRASKLFGIKEETRCHLFVYNAGDLAYISTVLTRASQQEWVSGSGTQEEVQMMCAGDQAFIACNHRGHELIEGMFNAFQVNSTQSFSDCLKKVDFLIDVDMDNIRQWSHDLGRRARFSPQEIETSNLYKNTVAISPLLDYELKDIHDRVVKRGAIDDRLTKPLLKMLGKERTQKYTALSGIGKTNGTKKTTRIANSVRLLDDDSDVHAELKLLAVLTDMLETGEEGGLFSVHIGGLKRACRKCREWMTSYKPYLDSKNIKLKIPESDTRPETQSPTSWNKPYLYNRPSGYEDLFQEV